LSGNDLQHTVTGLLVQWRSGDDEALNKLMPIVYEELKKLANRYMRSERQDHTLQSTALVHEAYLQLVQMDVSWNDRAHFFAIAARAMRRILVDHARTRGRHKRGGDMEKTSLDDANPATRQPPIDILDLDRALTRLSGLDSRQCQLVELHYFGGLTHDEMATVTGVSATTVDRELRLAKAWINRELSSQA
jgi:RNA polymerase sigma factor (TIGR02999 family)